MPIAKKAHMENYDKIWCFHFILCVRDNFGIGWKYQLPRLIYTNDYGFVVLLDVLGGASPSLCCICLFLQWIFSICFKKKKLKRKMKAKNRKQKWKKIKDTHVLLARKERMKRKRTCKLGNNAPWWNIKKIVWMFWKTQLLET